MDLKAVLSEVQSWPAEDRLLIEELWDGLTDEGHEPEPTEALKDLLDRRLEALDKNPAGKRGQNYLMKTNPFPSLNPFPILLRPSYGAPRPSRRVAAIPHG